MAGLTQLWEQLVLAICRPPRDQYERRDLLGGTSGHFILGKCICRREDFQITNCRGKRLEVSRFVQVNSSYQAQPEIPTVIYCHCNSGSRRDAEEAVYRLLPDGIAVVCLDFEGSGLSEGEHVTLGAHEVDDVQCVMEHLRKNNMASLIGLWGRSMGAVTALMCSQRDPTIAGIVCDSPFSRLKDLMLELVEEQKLPIPKPFCKIVLGLMRRSVKNRANFDIYEVSPLDKVHEAFVPALFGHGEQDTFILKHHSEKLHTRYAGEKNLIKFEGDHNSVRPSFFYTSAVIFFHNVLQIDPNSQPPSARGPSGVFERGSFWDTEHTLNSDVPGVSAEVRPEALQVVGDMGRGRGAAAPLEHREPSWWGSDGEDDTDGSNPHQHATWNPDGEEEIDIMARVLELSMTNRAGEAHPTQRSSHSRPESPNTGFSEEHGFGASASLRSMLPTSSDAEELMLAQAIAASLEASNASVPPELASAAEDIQSEEELLEPLVAVEDVRRVHEHLDPFVVVGEEEEHEPLAAVTDVRREEEQLEPLAAVKDFRTQEELPEPLAEVNEVRREQGQLDAFVASVSSNGGLQVGKSFTAPSRHTSLDLRPRPPSQPGSLGQEPTAGTADRRASAETATSTGVLAKGSGAAATPLAVESEEEELERLRNQSAALAWQQVGEE